MPLTIQKVAFRALTDNGWQLRNVRVHVADASDGKRYFVKAGRAPHRHRNELVVSRLGELIGAPTRRIEVVDFQGGLATGSLAVCDVPPGALLSRKRRRGYSMHFRPGPTSWPALGQHAEVIEGFDLSAPRPHMWPGDRSGNLSRFVALFGLHDWAAGPVGTGIQHHLIYCHVTGDGWSVDHEHWLDSIDPDVPRWIYPEQLPSIDGLAETATAIRAVTRAQVDAIIAEVPSEWGPTAGLADWIMTRATECAGRLDQLVAAGDQWLAAAEAMVPKPVTVPTSRPRPLQHPRPKGIGELAQWAEQRGIVQG